jgi:Glucodextranase, domain B/FecR protein
MDAPRSPRRSAPFILGLLAILAALPLGYFVFLRPTPAPPSPPVEEAPAPPPPEKRPVEVELKLEEIRGTVELRRGTGEWRSASVGEALRPSDAVRTREGSYAVLIGGEAVEVRMEAGTEVTVEALTASLSRLLLGNGMTTTRVKPGARHTFEVKAVGSDAQARTEGGTFSMSNNGKGTVAVGTREGEVAFLGQGKVVIVRAGQQSIVHPGRTPSEPAPIPTSLLLKVNWPAHPRRQALVSGQTEPGTFVDVAGQRVPTDKEGRFSHPVSLKEGRNTVEVRARSVGGLRQMARQELIVDTTPPKGVTVDSGLWGDPHPPEH